MIKKRNDFLSEFVSNQYPIDVFKVIISSVLDIVENFILELGEDDYLSLSTTSKYEERIGSSQRNTSSKIESLCIKKMRDETTKKDFIYKYGQALNSLNREEKQIFVSTFIKKLDVITIMEDMKLNNTQFTIIKKSAIVRFSLKMGLDKFISLFKKDANLKKS